MVAVLASGKRAVTTFDRHPGQFTTLQPSVSQAGTTFERPHRVFATLQPSITGGGILAIQVPDLQEF